MEASNYWTSVSNHVELQPGPPQTTTQNWILLKDSNDPTVVYITQDANPVTAITYDSNAPNHFLLKAYNPGDVTQQFLVNPATTDALASISCKSNVSIFAVAMAGDTEGSKIGPGTSNIKQWYLDTTV